MSAIIESRDSPVKESVVGDSIRSANRTPGPNLSALSMVTSVEIKNFRGFKDLAVEGLAPINVIVGDNASGKTAFLEAIYLAVSGNAQQPLSIKQWRGQANVIAANGTPRVHVLMIPSGQPGGIETICVDVARDHQNVGGNRGTTIEGWVNAFANSACQGWTTEKRDKLRLQAFLSAAWRSKPDIHFSQLFDLTRDRLVPLTGVAFDDVRQFLRAVEVL